MAKQQIRDLASELKGDPPNSTRGTGCPWWERMSTAEYQTLEKACRDWIDGGRMRRWFPSKAKLHLYLTGKHPLQACDPPVVFVKVSVFYKFVEMLETTHGKTP